MSDQDKKAVYRMFSSGVDKKTVITLFTRFPQDEISAIYEKYLDYCFNETNAYQEA